MGNIGKKILEKKEEENEENEEKEGDDDDKKRNEVRKAFKLKFEKKIAKYVPPKIAFKGNISKRQLLTKKVFESEYGASNLLLFNNYIILTEESVLYFYNKIFKQIFSEKFFEDDKEEILTLNAIDNQTIVIGATDKVRIVNFYEKKPGQITYELIQEIKDTKFYALNEKLSNGYLLIGGYDRKYAFYELKNKKDKVSLVNQYKLVNKVELVHNVYDDDTPGIVDLNNGRIFSWLNDDKNIKVLDYTPQQRIIYSKNGYGLHNAGLVSDKYLLLMGLIYPQYYTWVMDTESLEIVYKWKTPQNDSFMTALSENKFLYGSESRLACDEFSVENNQFKRKMIYEDYYCKDKEESWEDSFGVRDFLNEKTFITINVAGKMMVYYCKEK